MTTKRKSPDDEVIEDGAAVVTNEEAAAAAAVAAASMEDMPTMGDDANHEDAHEVGVALGGADVEEPAMIAPPVVVVPMQQQQQQQTHVVVEEQQQPLIPQHQEVNDPAIVINTTDENDNTMEPAPTLEERDKKRRAIGGDAPWNAMLFQLVYYKAVHGDLRPKAKEEEHKPLYDWMVLQRKEFKIYQETPDKSYLTPDQVKVLDHLQFPWNTRGDEHWFRNYEHLKQFRKEHGHCMVPRTFIDVPNLCHWVTDQRRQLKNLKGGKPSTMTKDRQRLLDDIGFVWQVRNRTTWDTRFAELMEFKEQKGTTVVPQHYSANKALGKWVAKQREQFKLLKKGEHSFLTPDRLEQLNSIGFVWSMKGRTPKEDMDDAAAAAAANNSHQDIEDAAVAAAKAAVAAAVAAEDEKDIHMTSLKEEVDAQQQQQQQQHVDQQHIHAHAVDHHVDHVVVDQHTIDAVHNLEPQQVQQHHEQQQQHHEIDHHQQNHDGQLVDHHHQQEEQEQQQQQQQVAEQQHHESVVDMAMEPQPLDHQQQEQEMVVEQDDSGHQFVPPPSDEPVHDNSVMDESVMHTSV